MVGLLGNVGGDGGTMRSPRSAVEIPIVDGPAETPRPADADAKLGAGSLRAWAAPEGSLGDSVRSRDGGYAEGEGRLAEQTRHWSRPCQLRDLRDCRAQVQVLALPLDAARAFG